MKPKYDPRPVKEKFRLLRVKAELLREQIKAKGKKK